MSVIMTGPIPIDRFAQFHELLCQTGGRYLLNPMAGGSDIFVKIEHGDYEEFSRGWNRINTPIRETRSSWIKNLLRRFKR